MLERGREILPTLQWTKAVSRLQYGISKSGMGHSYSRGRPDQVQQTDKAKWYIHGESVVWSAKWRKKYPETINWFITILLYYIYMYSHYSTCMILLSTFLFFFFNQFMQESISTTCFIVLCLWCNDIGWSSQNNTLQGNNIQVVSGYEVISVLLFYDNIHSYSIKNMILHRQYTRGFPWCFTYSAALHVLHIKFNVCHINSSITILFSV